VEYARQEKLGNYFSEKIIAPKEKAIFKIITCRGAACRAQDFVQQIGRSKRRPYNYHQHQTQQFSTRVAR